MNSKPIIRAVIAALILSAALLISWYNSRSPITPLAGVGDVYIELDRPGDSLFRLASIVSDYAPGGKAAAAGGAVEKLSTDLGGAWDFVAWNFKTAVALTPEGDSVVAINAGLMSPLMSGMFQRAGFIEDASRPGVLVKDGMAVQGEGGYWVIGRSESIPLAVPEDDKTNASRDKLDTLIGLAKKASPIDIFILPGGVERLSEDAFGADAPGILENWLSLSNWTGVVFSVDTRRRKIMARGKVVAPDTPLPDIFRKIKRNDDFDGLIHPTTERIFLVAPPSPSSLLETAVGVYKERPIPRGVITTAAGELKADLNLDLNEIASALRKEFGYVQFASSSGEAFALVAGTGLMASGDFEKMEKTISPNGWQTSAKGDVRFLKRLLAYKLDGGHVYMAYSPKILQEYLDGIGRPEDVPGDFDEIADKLHYSAMFYGGSLKSANVSTAEAKIEAKTGYFGIGLGKDDDGLWADFEMRFPKGPQIRPPFKIAVLLLLFGFLRTVLYVAAAIAASSLVFSTAGIVRAGRA